MKNSLISLALLLAAAASSAAPALAQRQTARPDWSITATKGTRSANAAITIGSQGVQASFQRGSRVPSGYDGGRYETRYQKVWVPASSRRVWVAPVYQWRYDSCGRRYRATVQAGYYRTECIPGFYEQRAVQVWVPARRIEVYGRGGDRRGRDYGRDRRSSHRTTDRAHRVSRVDQRYRQR